MDDQRLTAAQAAFRAGLKLGRWYEYVADGRAPQHDGVDYPTGKSGITRHGVRWWWRSTVDAWIRRRPEPKVEEHGTTASYSRHRYQREQPCEPCRAAWAERQRQRRNAQAEKGLPPRDPRHGTTYAYHTFNCRCDPCRAAFRRQYHARKQRTEEN